jgi:PAS domain S-box-containing protein
MEAQLNIGSTAEIAFPVGASQPLNRKFMQYVNITGREKFFEDVIITMTDLKGKIIYANNAFLDVAEVSKAEAIGAPHSIVRHPDTPRAVFKLLWDTIQAGDDIFAYVDNIASNGDNYWVFAHVSPIFDRHGNLNCYHSSRRVPNRRAVNKIRDIYAILKDIEDSHEDRERGMQAAVDKLVSMLSEQGVTYDEFIFSL